MSLILILHFFLFSDDRKWKSTGPLHPATRLNRTRAVSSIHAISFRFSREKKTLSLETVSGMDQWAQFHLTFIFKARFFFFIVFLDLFIVVIFSLLDFLLDWTLASLVCLIDRCCIVSAGGRAGGERPSRATAWRGVAWRSLYLSRQLVALLFSFCFVFFFLFFFFYFSLDLAH